MHRSLTKYQPRSRLKLPFMQLSVVCQYVRLVFKVPLSNFDAMTRADAGCVEIGGQVR